MGVPKEGRIKEGPTVVHVQMIEESGGGAALPDQAAGAGDGGCGGLHAGADGAVEPGLHGGHLLLLLLGVEHHLLLLMMLMLGGHGGRVREVRRGGGMRRRRRRLVPDLVVGQEPGEDVVGAGVGAAGARPGLEEVLADLAEQRARRRPVPQQARGAHLRRRPGRGRLRLLGCWQVEVLGHR